MIRVPAQVGLLTLGKSERPNLGSPFVSMRANKKIANNVALTATNEVRSRLQKRFSGLTPLWRIYFLRLLTQSYCSAYFCS